MTPDSWSRDAFNQSAFVGFRDLLERFTQSEVWPTLADLESQWLLARDIRAANGEGLRLVAQPPKSRRARPKSRDSLYDISVCNGRVPTRTSNWHDFFNVMMFAAFPRSKLILHARQRAIIERSIPDAIERLPGARTKEQDSLTMLDEGGVLIAADPAVSRCAEAMLDAGDHQGLARLAQAGRVRPWLIGHAHAEHLVKCSTNEQRMPLPRAKPVLLDVGVDATRERVDEALAALLALPSFCHAPDGRRAVDLGNLFLDLTAKD